MPALQPAPMTKAFMNHLCFLFHYTVAFYFYVLPSTLYSGLLHHYFFVSFHKIITVVY